MIKAPRATRKQLIRILVMAALYGLVPSTAALAVEFKQVIGIAKGDSLNIRKGPGRNYQDIGDLRNGAIVKIEGYDETGRWAKMRRRGQDVWVSTRYLADVNNNPDLSPKTHPERFGAHLVTAIPDDDPDGGLNMRAQPSRSGQVRAILPLSTPVDVVRYSADGRWCFIRSSYGKGWVRNKHLVKALPQNVPPTLEWTETTQDPQGQPLPALYRVKNVEQGDTLRVRNQPHARSAPLAFKKPGQRLMVIAWMSNGWAKVSVGQNIGYVNGRFLKRQRNQQGQNGFPKGLVCAGTEPFWTLTFNRDQTMTFKRADNANNPRTVALQATFPDQQTGAYPYTFRAGRFFGLLDQKLCSDGMSDISYGWSLKLMRGHPNGTTATMYGCCRLP